MVTGPRGPSRAEVDLWEAIGRERGGNREVEEGRGLHREDLTG